MGFEDKFTGPLFRDDPKVEAAIQRALADAPPLTPEQRATVARLMAPGAHSLDDVIEELGPHADCKPEYCEHCCYPRRTCRVLCGDDCPFNR